jgi:hypothetical protein
MLGEDGLTNIHSFLGGRKFQREGLRECGVDLNQFTTISIEKQVLFYSNGYLIAL